MASDGSLTFDTSINTAGFSTGTNAMSKMGTAAKVAVTAAISACVAGLVSFAKSSIETGSEFDAAMSQVAATMGTTSDQCEVLRDKAKEMGSTTAFTATEAAEGLNILAMAGYNATEQCEMIEPVLNLASAGATTLDNSASYLTTTLKGYCVTSEETGTMTQYYSDLMAKGATLVNTSVDELGEAMSRSSATANAYGQTVETTTTALLALADGGITGSQAANYLARMMSNLYAPTSAAKSAMDDLNVSAYDETGTARNLMDVIADLQNATAGLSDEESNAYMQTIMGTVGLKSYNVIANKSSDEISELTANLTDCTGAAKQMAETQLDNLQGDVTLLNSAVDGLKISLFECFEDTLRGGVQFITNTVIPALQAIIEHLPQIEVALIAVAAAVGTYMIATNAETIALYAMEAADTVAAIATKVLNAAMDANPILLVVSAVAALTAGLIAFAALCKDTDSEAAQLKEEMEELEDQIQETKDAYADTCDENEKTNESYKAMAKELEDLTSREKLTRAEQERLNSICEEFQNAGLDITYDSVSNSVDKSTDSVNEFVDAMAQEADYNAAVEEYNELAAERAELLEIQADAEIILSGETDATNQQIRKANNTYEEATQQLEELDAEMDAAAETIDKCGTAMDEMAESTASADESIQSDVEGLVSSIAELDTAYDEAYDSAMESLEGQFDLWEQVGDVVTTSVEDIMAGLESQAEYYANYADNIDNLNNRQIDGLDDLVAAYSDGSTQSAGYIASMASMTDEELEAMIEEMGKVTDQQGRIAESAAETATDYTNEVTRMCDEVVQQYDNLDQSEQLAEYGRETMNGYVEGIENEEGEVEETLVEMSEHGKEIFASSLDINSPSGVFRGYGEDTTAGYIEGISSMSEEVSASLSETTEVVAAWGEEITATTAESTAGVNESIGENFNQIPTTVSTSTDSALSNVGTWATNLVSKVKTGASGVLSNVSTYFSQVPGKISQNTNSSMSNVTTWCSNMPNTVKTGSNNVLSNITSYFSQIPGKVQTYTTTALNTVNTWMTNMVNKVKTGANSVLTNITTYFSQIPSKIQTYTTTALNTVNTWCTNMQNAVKNAFSNMVSQVSSSMSSMNSKITSALSSALSSVNSYASSMSSAGYTLGSNIVQGMINGINSKSSSLYSTINSVVNTAVQKANSAAGTGSPSRKTMWTGQMMDEGLAIGLTKYSGLVYDAMDEVMQIVNTSADASITAMPTMLKSTEQEIDQLSRQMKAAVNQDTQSSFAGVRASSQRAATYGAAPAQVTNNNDFNQTNNYYTQVANPSVVSRNQREALRKYVGGVA